MANTYKSEDRVDMHLSQQSETLGGLSTLVFHIKLELSLPNAHLAKALDGT